MSSFICFCDVFWGSGDLIMLLPLNVPLALRLLFLHMAVFLYMLQLVMTLLISVVSSTTRIIYLYNAVNNIPLTFVYITSICMSFAMLYKLGPYLRPMTITSIYNRFCVRKYYFTIITMFSVHMNRYWNTSLFLISSGDNSAENMISSPVSTMRSNDPFVSATY